MQLLLWSFLVSLSFANAIPNSRMMAATDSTSSPQSRLAENVRKYGWHVIMVPEDEKGPGFTYSVGFFETFKHPEVIIVGLDLELAHVLINNIGHDLKEGKRFEASTKSDDVLEGYDCYFTSVTKSNYGAYVGQALEHYQDQSFPVVQCVYPDTKGVYPWDKNASPALKQVQPILGETPSR